MTIVKFVLLVGLLFCVGEVAAQGLPPHPIAQQDSATEKVPVVLRHVAVIDVVRGQVQLDRTVVISDGHITDIGKNLKIGNLKDSQVVDATGKFLIPGLWDMHVHLWAPHSNTDFAREVTLPLLVSNGITGVRDMGTPMKLITRLRAEIAESMAGPRISASGKPVYESDLDELAARRAVTSVRSSGADFIKIFSWINRETFFAVADESKKQGFSFVGHVPELVSAIEASDAGQRSMEHSMGIWQSCSSAEFELRQSLAEATRDPKTVPSYIHARVDFGLPPRGTLDTFSNEKASHLAERFAQNETWQVPTLVEEQSFALFVSGHLMDQRGMDYVPSPMLKSWNLPNILTPLNAEDRQDLVRIIPMMLDMVGRMHRAGVRILPGSDAPWMVVPGFSLHDELVLLVSAGFTPAEALRSATLDSAEFLGLESSLGTIETGKVADLVLLDANPLGDIRNTQRISGIFLQGRYLNRKVLDDLLHQVKAQSAARLGPTGWPPER